MKRTSMPNAGTGGALQQQQKTQRRRHHTLRSRHVWMILTLAFFVVMITIIKMIMAVPLIGETIATQQTHPLSMLVSDMDQRKRQQYATDDQQSQKQQQLQLQQMDLRSRLLNLLQRLPNNTTQREISDVIVRTSQGGKITLCTQGGVPKLDRLVNLAGRWRGPISCAIYITTQQQLDEWLTFVNQPKHHQLIATYVSFHVLMEQPQLPLTVNRHPINMLRNLALRNAETDHVFLNDIDFMPPANAHDMLLLPLNNNNNTNNHNSAHPSLPPPNIFWVLPAFERFGPKGPKSTVTNVSWIPDTKAALLQALPTKTVAPFHTYFPAGHAPCNYTKWYTATAMYNITYDYLFEPYVIAHKVGLPEYFPTFRGFAFNKMSFFMEAHYRGYQYQVHPQAFVVHMNHGGRKGRNDKGGDSKYIKEDFRNYLAKTYHVPQKELKLWK